MGAASWRPWPASDDRLELAPADAVALPAVLDYHLHEGRGAQVPAVRLQGRDLAQFTILATVRRPLTLNMSRDIL